MTTNDDTSDYSDFDPEEATPLECADMYRALGFRVVPAYVPRPDDPAFAWKRPALPDWKRYENEAPAASVHAGWFEKPQSYNMGFITGVPALEPGLKLIVIDLDPTKKPQCMTWWTGFKAVCNNGMEYETPTAYTGGKGYHFYFEVPEHIPIKTMKSALGVDIRADGGFIVAPPSLHESGQTYQWCEGLAPWEVKVHKLDAFAIEHLQKFIAENSGSGTGSGGQRRTASPTSKRNPYGLLLDGREQYMTELIWAAVVGLKRASFTRAPYTEEELQDEMQAAFGTYRFEVASRLNEPLDKLERLEKEGRGFSLFTTKWHAAMAHWDGKVLEAALQPRIGCSGVDKFGADLPEPKDLPSALPPVMSFVPELVPVMLRPWVLDIAERMQCPPDYVAVSAIVAAGSVIGRKVGIRAQERTDWTEVCNLWGMIVGRPGVMKSPAMTHALKPLRRLDALAAEENERLKREYEKARASHKADDGDPPLKPPYKRYLVNDATYEALGEVMADNPNGTMVYRDELVSLLRPLGREDHAAARGFYLTAWNGNEGYVFDRIMRGRVHVEACCLSLLGATQPSRLASYLNDATQGGAGDDGFAQRFGLLVWPDVNPDWRDVDREPDGEARRSANFVFDRLDGLTAQVVGAVADEYDPIPYLRFSPEALKEFRAYRAGLEARLRGSGLHDAMVSHLNKYRGLVPRLALIFHLVNGAKGPVSLEALMTALVWAEYLETHAHRAYASVTSAKTAGARALLAKIRSGALPDPFTARDVYEKGWSGLGDPKAAMEALTLLADFDWLATKTVKTGGHPKTIYMINPKGLTR